MLCSEGDVGIDATPAEAAISLAACPVSLEQRSGGVTQSSSHEQGGGEFLAACDETGETLHFGNWWHKAAPIGGGDRCCCSGGDGRLLGGDRISRGGDVPRT